MSVKKIVLPNGIRIIDGLSKLLVIDKDIKLSEDDTTDSRYLLRCLEVPCKATQFITRKGREAIKIEKGDTHTISLYSGSGDRSWCDWDDRMPVNAMFADATATSNGGGCWYECIIMPKGVQEISTEEAEYMEEIGENT